jgi:hypothetical protein
MPRSLTALDPLARFRHLAMASGSQQPIPLRATRFVVRILDGMALVTAERCFRNAEARPTEATLTFPVPIHAALVGLSARIGERALARIEGASYRLRHHADLLPETTPVRPMPSAEAPRRRGRPPKTRTIDLIATT